MSTKSLFAGISLVLLPAALAPPAFAAASALVLSNGTLAPGSAGIAAVTHPSTGRYCILPNSSTVQAKQAAGKLFPQFSFNYGNSQHFSGQIVPFNVGFSNKGDCPSTSYIEVFTMTADDSSPVTESLADLAFDISF